MSGRIQIVEVGPRDGLQNDPGNLTMAQKLEFIARLIDAGVKRMEAGSFVSPKAVPKMADSGDVFRGLDRSRGKFIALALNEKGVRRAIDSRADEVNFVLVASNGFGTRNQGMTPEESADALSACAPLVHEADIALSATISVAFGDPYDGEVDPAAVYQAPAWAARRSARCGRIRIEQHARCVRRQTRAGPQRCPAGSVESTARSAADRSAQAQRSRGIDRKTSFQA